MIVIKNNFYENVKLIENPDDLLVLVNKENYLYEKFVPHNLKIIDSKYSIEKKFLRKEAQVAFEKMCCDAYKLGYSLKAESTYRDFYYQEKLYNNYVIKYGTDYACKCSARPGFSEHQTGLAVDIRGSVGDYNNFGNTKEFIWLKDNAYKYGFILRYPKDKEEITGFKYEPWHYRYVGDNAKYIHENNLTLEEYLNDFIS